MKHVQRRSLAGQALLEKFPLSARVFFVAGGEGGCWVFSYLELGGGGCGVNKGIVPHNFERISWILWGICYSRLDSEGGGEE